MNTIDKVEITGFWGNKKVKIKFFPDVNIFIGVNGSGKTTVINLIAAALSADFDTLDKLPFKQIRIDLTGNSKGERPCFLVKKEQIEEMPYSNIVYQIKENQADKFSTYSLTDYTDESYARMRLSSKKYYMYMRQMNRGIPAKLKSFVNVSWLSIHRAAVFRNAPEESYESSVDQKLSELNMDLGKYFSVLSSKVSDEINAFQRHIILSLLTEGTESSDIFGVVRSFDLDQEKKSLLDIFVKLRIAGKSGLTELDRHFDGVRAAIKKFDSPEPFELQELIALVNSYRSHKVVQKWHSLLEKQEVILAPKTAFVEVLNKLFEGKSVQINEKNEIEPTTDSGKKLPIRSLSSGEKQLIIILGEALLQESTPWIYIADEPELSLHMTWQEQLIPNLRLLNPRAQIVCATHSPDVVGAFGKNVFEMEKYVK